MTIDRTHGNVIFCDDIRREVDGKVSFIGCYMDTLVVDGSFPAMFPKFGVWIRYYEEASRHDEAVSVHLYMPDDNDGEPTFNTPLEMSTMRESNRSEPPLDKIYNPENGPVYLPAYAGLVFTQLIIKCPGLIRARLKVGDHIVRLGSLRIFQKQSS